jgi:hypothetical protein
MTKITAQTASLQRAVLDIKDRLAKAMIDEVVPHHELRSLIPETTGVSHYILVERAKRMLNAECGAIFATVRGEGYRRLANGVGADHASNIALVRIRSQSRRGQRLATMAIEFANDVNDVEKRKIYQKLGTLGLIEYLTLKKTVKAMPENKPPINPLSGLAELLGGIAK